jgi:hypothetical protein
MLFKLRQRGDAVFKLPFPVVPFFGIDVWPVSRRVRDEGLRGSGKFHQFRLLGALVMPRRWNVNRRWPAARNGFERNAAGPVEIHHLFMDFRFAARFGCFVFLLSGSAALFGVEGETASKPAPQNASQNILRQLDEGFVQVFEKVAPAVVVIEADKKESEQEQAETFDFFMRGPDDKDPQKMFRMPPPSSRSEASGFIVRKDGYIFTNNHAIAEAGKLQVRLKDGRRFPAKVVGTDDKTDVAVLKIEAANLPVVELGDSDERQRPQ